MAPRRHRTRAARDILLATFVFAACLLASTSVWASPSLGACAALNGPNEPNPAPSSIRKESVAKPARTIEVEELELLMTPTPLGFRAAQPACASSRGDAESDSSAPLCDPAGASMLAPLRLQAVEDTRLEAPRPCPELLSAASYASQSDGGHADIASSKQFLEAATLPAPTASISRPVAEATLRASAKDELPPGHGRGVYRPPLG